MKRFQALKLAVSHTQLYRKLEEFGQDYKTDIEVSVEKQSKFMERERDEGTSCHSIGVEEMDSGRKITMDNFDYHQNVHYMTEEHQNIDKHFVSVMATENRVSGYNLSDSTPAHSIKNMDNGKCVPSMNDHIQQRKNYITLVERIIVENIPCMKFLESVVTHHILHRYSKEMSMKSDTVS